jgi:uncharacterized protein (DUF1697 family)
MASGNVLLRIGPSAASRFAPLLERPLAEDFSLDVRVMMRRADELARVVADNPLGSPPENPSRFFVGFFSAPLQADRQRRVGEEVGDDKIWIQQSEAYLFCPGGFSLLAHLARLELALGLSITTRTWNTVTKLVALTSPGP